MRLHRFDVVLTGGDQDIRQEGQVADYRLRVGGGIDES